MSEIAKTWFEKAMTMKAGNKLLIECENKSDRTILIREFSDIMKHMRKIDPLNASKIYVSGVYKQRKHWVEIMKKSVDQTFALEIDEHGVTTKISIADLLTKKRQINLMLEENYSPALIQEKMELTEEEMYQFGLWTKS